MGCNPLDDKNPKITLDLTNSNTYIILLTSLVYAFVEGGLETPKNPLDLPPLIASVLYITNPATYVANIAGFRATFFTSVI